MKYESTYKKTAGKCCEVMCHGKKRSMGKLSVKTLTHVGTATDGKRGKMYQLFWGEYPREFVVFSLYARKCFSFSWDDLIKLAVKGGVDVPRHWPKRNIKRRNKSASDG